MNMQALMKQAQAMQKEITSLKNELDNKIFEGKSSLVTVRVKGTKELIEIKFEDSVRELINDDLSMLEDMVVVALNDAFKKVDQETEQKMGKYSNMMNGLL